VTELPAPEVSVDEATATADRVLQGRAYLEAAKPPSLRERFFDWLGELFGDLIAALSSAGGRGMAMVIIGVFALGILFLVYRLLRDGRIPSVRNAEHLAPVIDIERDLTASEWVQHAEEAEAAGDWRNGIRCRHRAMVATLADKELISPRPGQTAGEIAWEASLSLPQACEDIQAATGLFKDVWYGWVDADASSRDAFVEMVHRIDAAAGEVSKNREPVATGVSS